MAGHSKWANIKRRKAVQDAKKGQAYAKFSKDIIVAAKIGGGDPEGNFRLRTAIERAKAVGMPNDNIRRAIEKATNAAHQNDWEAVEYEGYGPGGAAIFIESLTDNRNRTAGDIRSYFNKFQGNLGADGCVAWIFKETGLISLRADRYAESELFELAAEAGAQDFLKDENPEMLNAYLIETDPEALNRVSQFLAEHQVEILSAEVTRQASTEVLVSDPLVAKPLIRLIEAIEEDEDVQALYTNAVIEDALWEQFGA